MIPVVWLSYHPNVPPRGYWDGAFLEALFDRSLWRVPSGYDFIHFYSVDEALEHQKGAVVVFNGGAAHTYDDYDRINADLAKLDWCIVVMAQDECVLFDWKRITHPNMKTWIMFPRVGYHAGANNYIGVGWPTNTRERVRLHAVSAPDKTIDWFFSGQINHDRRRACADALENMSGGKLHRTAGFAQGMSQDEYIQNMLSAKAIPCPSGNVNNDSFRLHESLESGCVPIADALPTDNTFAKGYWSYVFGDDIPFPTIEDWSTLPEVMQSVVAQYPRINNRVFAWWQAYKRRLAYKLAADIRDFVPPKDYYSPDEVITVLVPTSPIPSHPDTAIIEETINSVRERLPRAEIIVMIDGLRPEQESYRERYEEYTRRLLWKCNHQWSNVLPLVFEEHQHQSGMTQKALEYVTTQHILFVEHDCPLVGEIDWPTLLHTLWPPVFNQIRLHYDASIHPEHQYLMREKMGDFTTTMQWSQRPHLASTSYYKQILAEHFVGKHCMIEDVMHSVVQRQPWETNRLAIYTPEGNIKRSGHLDGRGSDEKWIGGV